MNKKNIIWSFIGLVIPLLAAVFAIPILLVNLGAAKFGILSLAWASIGYAGIIDLGIGKSVTYKLSKIRNTDDESFAKEIVNSASIFVILIGGILVGLLMVLLTLNLIRFDSATYMTSHQLNRIILLCGLAIPFQALCMLYRGVNEAYLNFKGISITRMIVGGLNFLIPLIISFFYTDMDIIIAGILFTRILACVAYASMSYQLLNKIIVESSLLFNKKLFLNLLNFGGWVALIGIISPVFINIDRFYIASFLSIEDVSAYSIPLQITSQSLIIITGFTTVMFPAVTRLYTQDARLAIHTSFDWLKKLTVFLCIITGMLYLVIPIILERWVNNYASAEMIMIGKLLCFSILFSGIGNFSYNILLAQGKSKTIFYILSAEFSMFLILIYFLGQQFGIIGVAAAWTIRTLIDAILLTRIAFYRSDRKVCT